MRSRLRSDRAQPRLMRARIGWWLRVALLHVLRVFTNAEGEYGNPLGVFLDDAPIEEARRRPIARALGFSETVFIEDARHGRLRIYTPGGELPFAGHPLVGVAALLSSTRYPAEYLNPPAGTVRVWSEGDLFWVRGRTEWCPTWTHLQARSPADLEAIRGAPDGHDHVQVWAFSDEPVGRIRARAFAPRFGVVEDEACGSASIILADTLGRPLVIDHGQGSEIHVTPRGNGEVDLGGRVGLPVTREVNVEAPGSLALWGQQESSDRTPLRPSVPSG